MGGLPTDVRSMEQRVRVILLCGLVLVCRSNPSSRSAANGAANSQSHSLKPCKICGRDSQDGKVNA